jgi:hypothetical protein
MSSVRTRHGGGRRLSRGRSPGFTVAQQDISKVQIGMWIETRLSHQIPERDIEAGEDLAQGWIAEPFQADLSQDVPVIRRNC